MLKITGMYSRKRDIIVVRTMELPDYFQRCPEVIVR
jgi:hypothetical protein